MTTIASPAAGPIPFSSTVSALPLPVAIERLYLARSTGVLTLEARAGTHVVYIRDGYPVSVELPGSFELIGRVLVEMKLLDDTAYQQSLAFPPPEGRRYGDLLVAQGHVTEDQLRQALKAQVRRKLHRLFFLTDSAIAFSVSDHNEGFQRNEPMRVHPWRASYHGVRSAWNADRLRQALAPITGRPVKTRLQPEELARFGLGPDDGRAAGLLRDQPFTIDALAAVSGLPIQPVSALCYALFIAGALEDDTPEKISGAYTQVRSPGSNTPANPMPVPSLAAQSVPAPVRPTGANPSIGLDSQRPTGANPSIGLDSQRPTGANPSIGLDSQRPTGANPSVQLDTERITTPNPAATSAPGQRAGYPAVTPAPTVSTTQGIPSAAATELEQLVEQRKGTVETDDLFTVLGLPRTATTEQIKIAYLDGARRFHPDRLAALGLQRLRPDVEKIFRRLSEAQSTLLDDKRRAEYLVAMDKPKPTAADAAAHQEVVNALEAEVSFRRGQTLLKRNDLPAALRDFALALQLQPKEGEHIIYVAWTRHCLGELDVPGTRTEIQRGLKTAPRAASAHYFLGMLYKEEETYEAALIEFKRAVALDDRQFEAEQEIRILAARRGKPDKKGLFDRFRKPGK